MHTRHARRLKLAASSIESGPPATAMWGKRGRGYVAQRCAANSGPPWNHGVATATVSAIGGLAPWCWALFFLFIQFALIQGAEDTCMLLGFMPLGGIDSESDCCAAVTLAGPLVLSQVAIDQSLTDTMCADPNCVAAVIAAAAALGITAEQIAGSGLSCPGNELDAVCSIIQDASPEHSSGDCQGDFSLGEACTFECNASFYRTGRHECQASGVLAGGQCIHTDDVTVLDEALFRNLIEDGAATIANLDVASRLPNLEVVYLMAVGLQGWLPDLCRHAPALHTLAVPRNAISGTVPTALWSCDHLELLAIDSNPISGTMPQPSTPGLGAYELTQALVGYTRISGSIPTLMPNQAPRLAMLSVQATKMSGTLPSRLPPTLQAFIAATTFQISGTLPSIDEWGTPSLQFLQLHESSHISGTMSAELGARETLQHYDISRNRISGSLPSTLSFHQELNHLAVQGNRISGTFPVDYANIDANRSKQEMRRTSGADGTQIDWEGETTTVHGLKLLFGDTNIYGMIPSSWVGMPGLYAHFDRLNLCPADSGAEPGKYACYCKPKMVDHPITEAVSSCLAAPCPYPDRCNAEFGCIGGSGGPGCAYCEQSGDETFFSVGSRCLPCGESIGEKVLTNMALFVVLALVLAYIWHEAATSNRRRDGEGDKDAEARDGESSSRKTMLADTGRPKSEDLELSRDTDTNEVLPPPESRDGADAVSSANGAGARMAAVARKDAAVATASAVNAAKSEKDPDESENNIGSDLDTDALKLVGALLLIHMQITGIAVRADFAWPHFTVNIFRWLTGLFDLSVGNIAAAECQGDSFNIFGWLVQWSFEDGYEDRHCIEGGAGCDSKDICWMAETYYGIDKKMVDQYMWAGWGFHVIDDDENCIIGCPEIPMILLANGESAEAANDVWNNACDMTIAEFWTRHFPAGARQFVSADPAVDIAKISFVCPCQCGLPPDCTFPLTREQKALINFVNQSLILPQVGCIIVVLIFLAVFITYRCLHVRSKSGTSGDGCEGDKDVEARDGESSSRKTMLADTSRPKSEDLELSHETDTHEVLPPAKSLDGLTNDMQEQERHLFQSRRAINAMCVTFILCYANLVATICKFFDTHTDNYGREYMFAFPELSPMTDYIFQGEDSNDSAGVSATMEGTAIACGIVLILMLLPVIVLPLIFAAMLYRAGKADTLRTDAQQQTIGALYDRYRYDCYWFGFAILATRASLVIVAIFAKNSPVFLGLLSIVVLLIATGAQLQRVPYAKSSVTKRIDSKFDIFQVFCYAMEILIFLLGIIVYLTPNRHWLADAIISLVVIVATVIVFVGALIIVKSVTKEKVMEHDPRDAAQFENPMSATE